MEANAIKAIEKKMTMSLDDLIKMNRKGGGKPRAAGATKGAKAPGPQGGKKEAPKTLVTKPGVAGKRQAIQQKKAAKAAGGPAGGKPAGIKLGAKRGAAPVSLARPKGVAKAGNKVVAGAGLKHSMAKKILSKARSAKQLYKAAPKMLTKKSQAAPKQLAQKKHKQQVQFDKPNPGLSLMATKSLDQTMKERRQLQFQQQKQQRQQKQQQGKKNQGQRGQQQRQQAPRTLVNKQGKARLQPAQQLHATRGGGIGKRGGPMRQQQQQQGGGRRAPIGYQQGMAPGPRRGNVGRQPPPYMYEQQYAPAQPRRAMPPPQMMPRHRPPALSEPLTERSQVAARFAHDPAMVAKMRALEDVAARQALKLQQLEDEVRKAERREHMYRQQQLNASTKPRTATAAAPAAAPAPQAQPAAAPRQPAASSYLPPHVSHGGMGGRSAAAVPAQQRGLMRGRSDMMDEDDGYGYGY